MSKMKIFNLNFMKIKRNFIATNARAFNNKLCKRVLHILNEFTYDITNSMAIPLLVNFVAALG